MNDKRSSRRREERQPLAVNAKVQGFSDPVHRWTEETRSLDVCRGGIAFPLSHSVFPGQVLQLQAAVPRSLRKFDPDAPFYNVFAIVRHAIPGLPQVVGAMFYGKAAPAGFTSSPTASFLLPSQSPDVRQFPRHGTVLTVKLRLSERSPNDLAITEDVSVSGARLLTALPVITGDSLIVDIDDGAVRTNARVCSVMPADHGVKRVSVFFLDPASREDARALLRKLGF